MADTLLIDAGNSCLKWAMTQGAEICASHRYEYGNKRLAALLTQWDRLHPTPGRVLLASVAQADDVQRLTQWVNARWGVTLECLASTQVQCGVVNCYERPMDLGVDRWMAMIAAWRRVAAPVCIVDAGTATTVDALTGDGHSLGGVILPGLGLMNRYLSEGATNIGREAPRRRHGMLACDTSTAVQNGGLQATVGLVDRVHAELTRLGHAPSVTLLTGGYADTLRPHIAGDVRVERDLVLQGMNIIAMSTTCG